MAILIFYYENNKLISLFLLSVFYASKQQLLYRTDAQFMRNTTSMYDIMSKVISVT